jgi:hypothetical protein
MAKTSKDLDELFQNLLKAGDEYQTQEYILNVGKVLSWGLLHLIKELGEIKERLTVIEESLKKKEGS